MDSELYDSLVESLKEAGKIRRGELQPSRVFAEADRAPGYVEETLESAG